MLSGGRWVVAVAAVLTMAITARLGVWQLDRAEQKATLQARIEARESLPALPADALAVLPEQAEAQHFRRIVVAGRWLPQHTVYLDNRQMHGRPGFFVVTPLLLDGGDAVLVQRGWIPRNFVDRAALPELPLPGGPVQVFGRVAPPPARLYEFADALPGRIRQNLGLASFGREIGLRLRPLSLQALDGQGAEAADQPGSSSGTTGATADSRAPVALQRAWPKPATDLGKHHGYAFQWFALCALTAGLYVWFQIIQPRRRAAVQSSA